VRRRRRRRGATIAKVIALAAVGTAGVLVWRSLQSNPRPSRSVTGASREEISPAEQRALDDLLKRKGASAER